MMYKNVRIADYIIEQDERNGESTRLLLGLSNQKKFIKPSASTNGVDLHNYKVIKRGEIALQTMDIGKKLGKTLPIALLEDYDEAIISPAYHVIKTNENLLPEYLFLYFLTTESERKLWFWSDSDIRGGCPWERFLELEIPLPPLEKQREYVAIYGNLLKLSNNHEKSFADLQHITDTFTEKLVEKYGTEELSDYIKQKDARNRDLTVQKVQGISIQKKFIDSKANMDGVPLSSYKIVSPGEFAYVTVTSRNGQKISIALNDGDESYIISSTYISFTIKDTAKLLPEFLLLWFKRPEFDRYARYNSWGSARETFDWSEMQRVRLPIPPITVQKSIVAIHHALESRKRLAERLKTTIKEISPVLIKNAKDTCVRATI